VFYDLFESYLFNLPFFINVIVCPIPQVFYQHTTLH